MTLAKNYSYQQRSLFPSILLLGNRSPKVSGTRWALLTGSQSLKTALKNIASRKQRKEKTLAAVRCNNKRGKEERKCWRRWRRRGIMCIWVPSMHLTVHTISPACQPVRCPVKTKRKNSQKLAELSESENENFDQNIRWWGFREYECVCLCIKFRALFLQHWS